MEQPDEIERRGSDIRFRRGREELAAALKRLLGSRHTADFSCDADRAAAVAAEARAGHRTAEEHPGALVRRYWQSDARTAVTTLLHAIGARVRARPVWLVIPGREPQAVPLSSDVVLDNPLGFAALAHFELVLLDRELPAGLWLGRHAHHYGPAQPEYTWELEVWGTEPWLSAATRAIREAGDPGPPAT